MSDTMKCKSCGETGPIEDFLDDDRAYDLVELINRKEYSYVCPYCRSVEVEDE